jgi:RHS repeat-associated protein
VSGNEIAKLAENGELAGGWLVAGFLFHALPCGKPQTRKPTFFIPQPSFRWDTNDSESYSYNQASQRTAETNTAGDFRNYTYDNASELKAAVGKEAGGTTNRWQEQLGYAYDAAGNLNYRTNNGLLGAFNVNNLNELTTVTNGGRLTVAGTTTIPATSVTVNSSNAILYADATFAATNMPLINGTNTFTAIGQDSYGHSSTNVSICYLPTTNSFSYDLNGNLLSDTNRNFAYDDENQLTSVWVTNVWREDFVYDGKFRRRIEKDFAWQGGTWAQTNEIHSIYDGNSVIQERDANNNPLVTYTRSGSSLLARTDYGQEIPGSPTTAYYHLDGNANVTMLIYANQNIAARYGYGPFGDTLSMSGPLANLNTYRFASKEWNNSAGIYNFGRRYYDPILQRWLNRDPIQELGDFNLYRFVANNPANLRDKDGRFVPELIGIGLIVIFFVSVDYALQHASTEADIANSNHQIENNNAASSTINGTPTRNSQAIGTGLALSSDDYFILATSSGTLAGGPVGLPENAWDSSITLIWAGAQPDSSGTPTIWGEYQPYLYPNPISPLDPILWPGLYPYPPLDPTLLFPEIPPCK